MEWLPRKWEGLWRWGRWWFLLHDSGWWLARNQVLVIERPWPRTKFGTKMAIIRWLDKKLNEAEPR